MSTSLSRLLPRIKRSLWNRERQSTQNSDSEANKDLSVKNCWNEAGPAPLVDLFLGSENYRNPFERWKNYSGKKMFIRQRGGARRSVPSMRVVSADLALPQAALHGMLTAFVVGVNTAGETRPDEQALFISLQFATPWK
jgi:hypothetical protein